MTWRPLAPISKPKACSSSLRTSLTSSVCARPGSRTPGATSLSSWRSVTPRSPTTTSSEPLMARTQAPRILGAVVVLAAVATACSSPSTRLPLTRAAGADSVAQQDIASTDAPRPASTLGPLDQHLVPDVLVRLTAPLQSTQTEHLVGLVPAGRAVMLRTGKLTLASPKGSGDISAAGVDPAVFRRFTPKNTAE